MAKSDRKNGKATLVVRREEVVEGGHHGGAWKVAYADFVTAMMAFFLLMWLLNATTEEQRKGLADYFSPTSLLSHGSSGTGQPFGGKTAFEDGKMISDMGSVQVIVGRRPTVPDPDEEDASDTPAAPVPHSAFETPPRDDAIYAAARSSSSAAGAPAPAAPAPANAAAAPPGPAPSPHAQTAPDAPAPLTAALTAPAAPDGKAEQEKREEHAMQQAAQQIRNAVRGDPALASVARQLSIDVTPEGLRIQILDEDRQPMFATGSAVANERARLLLRKVAPVLMTLKEDITIAGHTDATPYKGGDRTNWELSADRANDTRRLLVEAGLPPTRIRSVTGNADRDPLLPSDPFAAANRRIAILVLRTPPGSAAAASPR